MLVVQMKRWYPILRFRNVCDSQIERDIHHNFDWGRTSLSFFKDDKLSGNIMVFLLKKACSK